MRGFLEQSTWTDGSLALAVSSALTPKGIDYSPVFFEGWVAEPQILARGLLVLSDITSTRYFNYTPEAQRDPILTAQGDRLRSECFSACNGVYARLDLLQAGFDGKIDFGTTNVDIGSELRQALIYVQKNDKMHLNVGNKGLKMASFGHSKDGIIDWNSLVYERPVEMPDRWVKALGNAAPIHRDMEVAFSVKGLQAQQFIAGLPSATGKAASGWLSYTKTGIQRLQRPGKDSVFISGLHRLSALKRVMTNIQGITFYRPLHDTRGAFMIAVHLPNARLTLSLTAESWQGYSGEGALLTSLAQGELLEDAESIASVLAFHPVINREKLEKQWSLSKDRVEAALALLAVSGKLGYDAFDGSYYHRELPSEPGRVEKDNPRLAGAKKLMTSTEQVEENQWIVHSKDNDYRVIWHKEQNIDTAKCTCRWYMNHQNSRGPCKHILAVQLKEGGTVHER